MLFAVKIEFHEKMNRMDCAYPFEILLAKSNVYTFVKFP